MSWIITGSFAQPDEPEALAYIAAVEAADGQTLEDGVKFAYNSFIKGCKADGIWNAIKASCILAGARTLDGALVPLVGTAPTNYNFVSGDYNRETGLVGDGSTKYLDSNRANNADPQDSNHNTVYATTLQTVGTVGTYIASQEFTTGANNLFRTGNAPSDLSVRNRSANSAVNIGTGNATGLIGVSRSNSSNYQLRSGNATTTHAETSESPSSSSLTIFSRAAAVHTNARLSFYSIGESLDLAALDTRVTTLMSDLAAAIP